MHDSFFVLGHFHYVLSLGAVYTIFACLYNYLNLITSLNYGEMAGRLQYIFFFFSSNVVFLPMHVLGVISFPRRIYNYPIGYVRFGWFYAFGLIGILASLALFALNAIHKLINGFQNYPAALYF
jgi:cytochrome c oxidase subunit 1